MSTDSPCRSSQGSTRIRLAELFWNANSDILEAILPCLNPTDMRNLQQSHRSVRQALHSIIGHDDQMHFSHGNRPTLIAPSSGYALNSPEVHFHTDDTNPNNNRRYASRSIWPDSCLFDHSRVVSYDNERPADLDRRALRWCCVDGKDTLCWKCSLFNRRRLCRDIQGSARPLCDDCTGKAMGRVQPDNSFGLGRYPNGYNSCSCVREYADFICAIKPSHLRRKRTEYIRRARQEKKNAIARESLNKIFPLNQPQLLCPCGKIIDVRGPEAELQYRRMLRSMEQWPGLVFNDSLLSSQKSGWASMCPICQGLLVEHCITPGLDRTPCWVLPTPDPTALKFPEALS